jgi:hypothetical protein
MKIMLAACALSKISQLSLREDTRRWCDDSRLTATAKTRKIPAEANTLEGAF